MIYISPIPPIKGTIETTMGKSSMRNRQDLEPGSPFSPLRRQESSPAMFGRRCSKGAARRGCRQRATPLMRVDTVDGGNPANHLDV